MANSWPSILPCYPLSGTYSAEYQENITRFQPEVGPSKSRRRYTSSIKVIDATFKFTKEQMIEFDRFYFDRLKDGSLPFEMRDPLIHRFYYYAFEETPRVDQVATVYQVSVRLRQLGPVVP
jgi:hypothetical protein